MECNIMYIYAIILLVILLIVTAWLGPVPLEHFTLPPGTSRVYNKVSNVDAPFGDIKYYDGAFGDCAKQCDNTPNCAAYVTHKDRGRGCWLKQTLGNRNSDGNRDIYIGTSKTVRDPQPAPIQYEYKDLTSGKAPPNGSCVNLAAQKGWINPNDESAETKARKEILADFEIARVPQDLFSTTIYPNLEACTIHNNVIDLYYNTKGQNIIDPNTCLMRGVTADDAVVYHQMKRIHDNDPLTPKGCLIDLSTMDRASFNQLVDDAYQLKKYPELRERKEYQKQLDSLLHQNQELQKRYDEAANQMKMSAAKNTNETNITGRVCEDRYTNWDTSGGWAFNYLDRHNVKCNNDEVLTKFKLESAYQPDKTRYKYRCCKVESGSKDYAAMNTSAKTTPIQDALNWNTKGLESHPIDCHETGTLQQFVLESRYDNKNGCAKPPCAKYNYTCASFEPTGQNDKKVATKCRHVKTEMNQMEPTFNYLDRHEVACNDGEAINGFALKSDGKGKMMYEYSCCKPVIE